MKGLNRDWKMLVFDFLRILVNFFSGKPELHSTLRKEKVKCDGSLRNHCFSSIQERSNVLLLTCNDNFSARSANGAMRDLHPCCKFDHVLQPPVAHSVTGLDSSASVLYKRN